MILSFYTIPPQPAGESSLILGSKLVRSVELRFIVKSFYSSLHQVITTKASNNQIDCRSCRLYQEEELKSKWDFDLISIIHAHKPTS